MKLFTKEILNQLTANGKATRQARAEDREEPDHKPVVKIFNPCGSATWLLTESEPDEPDVLYGLCDLGQGFPELGNVSRSELESIRAPLLGIPLERDLYFAATYPLMTYYKAAQHAGMITEDAQALKQASLEPDD